jgi:hypothetical protein
LSVKLSVANFHEDDVHVPAHVAQVLVKRRRVLVPGAEPEAVVAAELRHRDQTELLLHKLALAVVVLAGGVQQLAVVLVGPAVVRALEEGGVVAVGPRDAHAAVAAGVEEGVDLALVVAYQHDRIHAAGARDEVARLRDLAVVPDEEPRLAEDPLELEFEDLRVGEDAARDQPFVRAHDVLERLAAAKPRHGGRGSCRHAISS